MSITLELTPQEEELLRSAATKTGQQPNEYVKDTILQSIMAIGTPSQTLQDAETEWDRWSAVGHAATDAARADLRAHGIRSVYRQEGIIVEELPDGTIRPLDSVR